MGEAREAQALLSEQEAAVYDRQIRVWGVDAQRRLTKVRVLVIGMSNAVAEACKNIVLAGIGSLTLMDDGFNADSANFLIPADQCESGKDSIVICAESLKDFNPMVHVSVEKGSLTEKPAEYLDNFDVVVVGRSHLEFRVHVNALCRKRSVRIVFFAIDCRGSLGEMFVDLQTHTYALKVKDSEAMQTQELRFSSLEETIAVRWEKLPKKTTKLFFAMRILEEFEYSNSRMPGQVSLDDLTQVLAIRKRLCEAQGMLESWVPEKLLQRLLDAGPRELPTVCAIMGGILGQELVKAMSGKGEPVRNFFYFDPLDGRGIMEAIPT